MINKILFILSYKIKLFFFKIKWRKINRHNFTTVNSVFPINLVTIGKYSYGPLNIYNYEKENSGLQIGNFCSIALDVKFILGGNHFTNRLLTYPIEPMLYKSGNVGSYSKGKIIIGHDCWIGNGSIILSGVDIGNGSVVAAGSVVTKAFPPYSIIGGSPAKLIRKRFTDEMIDELNKNQDIYDRFVINKIENFDIFQTEINDINKLISIIKKI
ncbi:CatB-related O-acetyltransferase [Flavobacterium ammonificans]|uniref:CatB-related O-acetyltransferase n=1 Tax=Flavobacterium ammonificans TaxID=1751056 RepID=A0ABN6KU95_9FLAO|nr:CatB-related O-acetyltransferase [Flavobacterium ammonificans]BDB52693.1 hypothetical protein GENT11_10050 [Flavobacterium ammonificans]